MSRKCNLSITDAGVRVKSLVCTSAAFKAGLRRGDRILSVNGMSARDELDVRYNASCEMVEFEILRNSRRRLLTMVRRPGTALGLEFNAPPIKRCRNNCLFCFINQLPPGLRKSLYIKDEDIDHSFVNGNYVTLTSASPADLQRIVDYGISPLYLSVHATSPTVRRRLLRNRRAPDIREQLSFLEQNGIRFHTQIVVCPGINDGECLNTTISDLLGFGQALLSIAVVPVGLTRFHRDGLHGVDAQAATRICTEVSVLRSRDVQDTGMHRVFLADELFIRAGFPIPPASYYCSYPQIENGVGLVRTLLNDWSKKRKDLLKTKQSFRSMRTALVTGTLAAPYLRTITRGMEKLLPGRSITVIAATNRTLGESITVAGLLTAADIIHALKQTRTGFDRIVLPGAIFNHRGHTLDGFSRTRIQAIVGTPVRVACNTGQLCSALRGNQEQS